MSDSRLPTEVELIYEVMPCNALRASQEPPTRPHACSYFRRWGYYHSFDHREEGQPEPGSQMDDVVYTGRAPLIPEVLSGCRKAPIMAVGINPNLPGWWPHRHNSVNPVFDDYKQFAHYFRYRAVAKWEIPRDDYQDYGGSQDDRPLLRDEKGDVVYSQFELNVPADADGKRRISVIERPQKMYQAYQELLDLLAETMDWDGHHLALGEDLSYGNMVACPSAKWTTRSDNETLLPGMTQNEMRGIVGECFHSRKYFLRQLFQSLPNVLLIFSNSTARAFIGELKDRFIQGSPDVDTPMDELMAGTYRLLYGQANGKDLTVRVIFAPHITGTPEQYEPARAHVVEQLRQEVEAGNLIYNSQSGHLSRPAGACVMCPMLEIGPCDYEDELEPISDSLRLTSDSSARDIQAEKRSQQDMLALSPQPADEIDRIWLATGEMEESEREEPNES